MTGSRATTRVVGLLLLVSATRGGLATSPARADGFGEQPMSASVAELRSAAAAARRPQRGGAAWLLDEEVVRVDPGGAVTTRTRRIIAIDSATAVARWQSVGRSWSPWYEDPPTVDARVLDRDGAFHRLDPATVDLGSPPSGEPHGVGEQRWVQASLPAVAPGAIAEIVTTVRENKPRFAAGSVHSYTFGYTLFDVAQSRVIIDAPAGTQLAVEEDLHGVVARRVEQAGGRILRIYEATDLARSMRDDAIPADFWASVAHDYAALVRGRIEAGPLPSEVRIQPGAGRRETIRRAVDFMHRELRCTGLELGLNDFTPWTPAEVWQHRYGDGKDLATFLVALLARAGIEAEVALVDDGPREAVSPGLPGLDQFDHAIVHVPGEKLWIDPSLDLARPGQLSAQVEGRLALVAGTRTRATVRTPSSRADDNRIVVARTIMVAEIETGAAYEVSHFSGLRELAARTSFQELTPEHVAASLERQVKDVYRAERLVRHRVAQTADLSNPFTIEVAVEGAENVSSRSEDAVVWIDLRPLFEVLPHDLRRPPEKPGAQDAGSRRWLHPRVLEPHVVEWRYTIHLPDGFETGALPARELSFGPASYSQRFAAKGREVRGQVRFTLSRARIAPDELDALAKGVASLLAEGSVELRFEHRVQRKLRQGDLVGAMTDAKRLVDLAPGDAGRLRRYAYALLESGLAAEAVAVQREAVKAAPSGSWAHAALSWTHRHDAVGRLDEPGFDRASALAAMEQAVALAPTSGRYQHRLGLLLSYGDGASFLGGDLKRAAQALARARELGETDAEDLLLCVLLGLRDTARLAETAAAIQAPESSGAFRLAAAEGDIALQLALDQIPEPSREKAVSRFVFASLQVGDYERVRRLLRGPNASLAPRELNRDLVARLRNVPADPKTAGDVLARWMADATLGDGKRWLSRDAQATLSSGWWFQAQAGTSPLPGLTRTRQLFADVVRARFEVRSVDRAGPVEQLEGSSTQSPVGSTRVYVVRGDEERDRPRVLGLTGVPRLLAPAVLRAADAGRLEDARRILDWVAAEGASAAKLDAAAREGSRLWRRGQKGDLRRIRLAAAALLALLDPEKSLAILDVECPRAPDVADGCRVARHEALAGLGRYREAVDALDRLTIQPDAHLVAGRARLLVRAQAWPELERFAASQLPDEAKADVQESLAQSWIARGQPERARAVLDSLRASEAGKSLHWRNQTSWFYLFTDGDMKPVVAELEEAVKNGKPGWGTLHTLAVCYARIGRHRDALETIRKVAGWRGRVAPMDRLVAGRIAAAAGLTAAARREYEAVISDPRDDKNIGASAALARRWLAELPR